MQKLWAIFCLFVCSIVQAEVSYPVQGKLDNGLHYTILPLHEEKGHLEIRIKVYAGSVDENDDQAGVAHMVEHLVFRATDKYPQGIMPHLHSQKWVRGRNYNAVTTNDNTTYMLTPPANVDLAQSLDALSQMLFFAKITQSDLDDERKVILEEWRGGLGVGSRMSRARTNVVRMDSRYARHPIIGTEQSIRTMPAEQLQKFYQEWYAPNNMQLLIVGDVEVADAKQLIEQYFGNVPARKLAARHYLEPTLSNELRTVQIQDEQSAMSQIAYILRFDESKMREQTDDGRYLRWLDRLAVALVVQRFRNQQENLPDGIRSIVLRKSDIGQTSVALAVFAGVDERSHQQGLRQIFIEIERLKRFPITQAELDRQKEKIQAQIDRAKKHDGNRDFSGWVQAMVESVLMDKPYLTQPETASLIEPIVHKISLNEINQHIQSWFRHQDRIVQYQAPRLTKIDPIEVDLVKNLQKQAALSEISPPQQEKMIEPMALSQLKTDGKIQSEQAYPTENVIYFTLSNGDRVVWLKSALAKEKSYFEARSSAGFNAESLQPWQSQIAVQLIAQNAPLDWEIEQLKRWKELKKVNLTINQKAEELHYTAVVDNDKLADLWRLFYAYQQETQIKDGLDEIKESLARSLDLRQSKNSEQERSNAVNKLLFGKERTDILPNKASLAALSQNRLNQIWQQIRQEPVVYYVVNDLDEREMRVLIERYLSAIPRQSNLKMVKQLPLNGRETLRLPVNLDPKNNVKMWFFQDHSWQAGDAVLVAMLRNIAVNKLKLSLRDEHLGIYSLRLESQLNPSTHRIESQLMFSVEPQKSDEMIALAEKVLQDLPNLITPDDVQTAKAQFLLAEKERLKSPLNWLHRLILSDKQFNSPRYLSEVVRLADSISLQNMQKMAAKLYNANNVKVFIETQK